MKAIVLFLLLISARCADTTPVYTCDSHSAKRYHLKANCKGLNRCTHRIVKITLDEARKRGKTLCNLEK